MRLLPALLEAEGPRLRALRSAVRVTYDPAQSLSMPIPVRAIVENYTEPDPRVPRPGH